MNQVGLGPLDYIYSKNTLNEKICISAINHFDSDSSF